MWSKKGDLTLPAFAGIKARATTFGPSDYASDAKRAKWIHAVADLAQKGK